MTKTDTCGAVEACVGLLVDSPWAVWVGGDVLVARVGFGDREALAEVVARDALARVAGGEEVGGGCEGAGGGCYPGYRGGNVL